MVQEWDAAEELVAGLPRNEPRTLLLQSRPRFVRGEVADGQIRDARSRRWTPMTSLRFSLAKNIRLYSGDFADAQSMPMRAASRPR